MMNVLQRGSFQQPSSKTIGTFDSASPSLLISVAWIQACISDLEVKVQTSNIKQLTENLGLRLPLNLYEKDKILPCLGAMILEALLFPAQPYVNKSQ